MKILVYIDGPSTEGLNPPSSFTSLLLPELCAAMPQQSVIVMAFGLERPPALDLPENVTWIGLPLKTGLAGWFWDFRGMAAKIRGVAADRVLLVNPPVALKGLSYSVLSEGTSDFTINKTIPESKKPHTVFHSVPFTPISATGDQLPGSALVYLQRPAGPRFEPLEYPAMEATRLVHTGGRSYFIYAGVLGPGIMDLVRAFSIFKKRQKSDWKLVLAGQGDLNDRKFVESLAYYKYKDDLVLLRDPNPAILPSLFGAAYAALFPAGGSPGWLAEFFALGVPAIVPDQPAFHGNADEALSFYDTGSQTDIAEYMMTLYKDESLRSRKKEAGIVHASRAGFEDLAVQVCSHLLK